MKSEWGIKKNVQTLSLEKLILSFSILRIDQIRQGDLKHKNQKCLLL